MANTVTIGSRKRRTHGRESDILRTCPSRFRPCLISSCDLYTSPVLSDSFCALFCNILGPYVSGTVTMYKIRRTLEAIAMTPSIQRQPAPVATKPPMIGPSLNLVQWNIRGTPYAKEFTYTGPRKLQRRYQLAFDQYKV